MENKFSSLSHGSNRSKGWLGDILAMVVVGMLIALYYYLGNSIFSNKDPEAEDSIQNILFSVSVSVFLYIAFRQMFSFLNRFFPWKKTIWKRILLQVPLIFLIAGFGMVLFMTVWEALFVEKGYTRLEVFNNISTAIIVSLIINLLYESISIYRMLKNSEIESEKLKRRNIESHYEILKNQVGPHFLFNSLNTLLSLMDEDIPAAKEFVEKLAAYYRYSLQVNDRDTNSIASEIKLIEHFVFLLKCRFGNNLSVEIDSALYKENNRYSVPMAIQMLVENAVKHNIISADKPLKIKIGITEPYLFVENNLQKKEALDSSNGIGLDNIRNRYQMLNNQEIIITDDGKSFKVMLPIIKSV